LFKGRGKEEIMAKKTVDTERESLVKELKSLIPRLDSEGLAFLVEQAKIHLYNMQVDELNKTAAQTSEKSRAKGTAKPKAVKSESREVKPAAVFTFTSGITK
jgi:hypothetical protein